MLVLLLLLALGLLRSRSGRRNGGFLSWSLPVLNRLEEGLGSLFGNFLSQLSADSLIVGLLKRSMSRDLRLLMGHVKGLLTRSAFRMRAAASWFTVVFRDSAGVSAALILAKYC